VEALHAAGVTKLFGLMGSSTLEMYDALYDVKKDIEYIGVRHENCGMHMADAYGRVSGSPGIVAAQSVGAANMAAALQDAWLARVPLADRRAT
jgi:acetolactate synthase-1/2/3 large subunit/sulfoacetaldehyde acetyltransferase